jgi:phosphopantetheinyl transferase
VPSSPILDLTLLDAAERRRALTQEPSHRHNGFVAGVRLAKQLIAYLAGCDPSAVMLHRRCSRCGGLHGRVAVTYPAGYQLSLTHAPGIVGAAVSATGDVGIDVEPWTSPGRWLGLRDVLASAAPALLAMRPGSDDEHEVLRAWVRWEALAKAHGAGLRVAPARVAAAAGPSADNAVAAVHMGTADGGEPPDHAGGDSYLVFDAPGPPGHLAAIATSSPPSCRRDRPRGSRRTATLPPRRSAGLFVLFRCRDNAKSARPRARGLRQRARPTPLTPTPYDMMLYGYPLGVC